MIERTLLVPEKDRKKSNHRIARNISTSHVVIYRARRKLKNCVKLHVDQSKRRFKLLLDAQKHVKNVGEFQFVYADVNCILKVSFSRNDESFFTSMQELEDIFYK